MIKNMANYPSREHAPEKHATKNNRSKIPQKYNQSINALHEIKKYQDTTDLLIRIKPFLRLVKKDCIFLQHRTKVSAYRH